MNRMSCEGPLRKVVDAEYREVRPGLERYYETLECGHDLFIPSWKRGRSPKTNQRRCRACKYEGDS